MPHDIKGVKLEVGDIVKGKATDARHEVVGKVLELFESDHCSVKVCCVTKSMPILYLPGSEGKMIASHVQVADIRYCDAADCEKIA